MTSRATQIVVTETGRPAGRPGASAARGCDRPVARADNLRHAERAAA